ncbi:two-component system sensor histidine kinase QseC [Enterobacteriaceae bacterium H20N1]|uniref:Sensor protein QseC n=1 Tax=Dryocola boscaweniae TaxID=2925397 RepID=A0A9X2W7J8_9ENTR|nr:quorum sensing histidine kinase QseC [Dryocola boscaweniae]MCT4702623.1 two-component system sensor histidine kinase QseC [Dryocola boscaweniae]MCT4719791.1 two-component system sensor histidine kinase QseC [Dryocola boscaweniae]
MKKLTQSLRARLIASFILLTAIAWAGASVAAWHQTSKTLDKLFDTQQLLFAKRLSALDLRALRADPQLPRTKKMVPHHRGKQDDDTLAFAIFSVDGQMRLNDGDNGKDLRFDYRRDGFTDGYLNGDDDPWRLVWLTTPDGRYRIVVGQEREYREDMALDIVTSQLLPWLIALPLMLLLLVWLVSRALAPLHKLAAQLRQRSPDDARKLETQQLPLEIKPLVNALNTLFTRTGEFMLRERRFTSDAAHELRSPLAALKVQAEVAQLAANDPQMREHALNNLTTGTERASRLVDQLLTLSRLDSLADLDDIEDVSLPALLQSAVMDAWHQAQREGVDIRLELKEEQVSVRGQTLLLSLMVRNLLDNAVRYSPGGSLVNVVLRKREICITDNGSGISPEFLPKLGERFFRPPGLEKTGSGLGLSIVQRIASLHGMNAQFSNVESGGFQVRISW